MSGARLFVYYLFFNFKTTKRLVDFDSPSETVRSGFPNRAGRYVSIVDTQLVKTVPTKAGSDPNGDRRLSARR